MNKYFCAICRKKDVADLHRGKLSSSPDPPARIIGGKALISFSFIILLATIIKT